MQNKIKKELDEQKEMLNNDFESYREELSYNDNTTTIAELVENANLDSVDFNIGFEQGYMRGLEIALSLCDDKVIDYYGNTDNYIHLKFGDVRKRYSFTDEFRKEYPLFTIEYLKYITWNENTQFKNPFQLVNYVYENNIPVHFYYNFTDTPAKNQKEIINYLTNEN